MTNNFNYSNCNLYSILKNEGQLILRYKEVEKNKSMNLYILIAKLKIKYLDQYKTEDLFIKGKVTDSNNKNNTYFKSRYYLFSKYDDGIILDDESWYSVTPEDISKYIAKQIVPNHNIIIDGFGGAGGNTIQFSKEITNSKRDKYLICNEISEEKIKIIKNNTSVYNCNEHNIIYSNRNFLELNNKILNQQLKIKNFLSINKEDICVFLSPPWGGIDYKYSSQYNMKEKITPNIVDILNKSKKLAGSIVLYLPRSIDLDELFDILIDCNLIGCNSNDSDDYYNSEVIDIELLVSSNKIKAVLVSIGENYSRLSVGNIRKFLKTENFNLNEHYIDQFVKIIKEIGFERFIISCINCFIDEDSNHSYLQLNLNEVDFNINTSNIKKIYNILSKNNPSKELQLIKYIQDFEMTEEELNNYNILKNTKDNKEEKKVLKSNEDQDKNKNDNTTNTFEDIFIDKVHEYPKDVINKLIENCI